jgi:hypothetical protein
MMMATGHLAERMDVGATGGLLRFLAVLTQQSRLQAPWTTPLIDFDIALSLNQRGLCSQFEEAWRVWNRRAATPFTILATPLNHRKQPSTTRLQANLGSPQLSLDAQRMASQEVLTTFELLDGTLAYMSGSDPVELPIHKYSLSIRSMVRKRTVSRAVVQAQSTVRRGVTSSWST